jgi:hypothetical protein
MPEISRFFGIVIAIYYNDHMPAHFHARYGEHGAKIEIATGLVLEGMLPRRVLALVEEWRGLRRIELEAVWQQIMDRKPHDKIEPLE